MLSLVVRAGLAGSNGEARRHVQGGAVKINDKAVSDERQIIGTADITADGVIKLSVGKKSTFWFARRDRQDERAIGGRESGPFLACLP